MRSAREELLTIVSDLRRHVQYHRVRDVRYRGELRPSGPAVPASAALAVPITETKAPASSAQALQALREEIGDCQRCPLGATRIKLAYGVGNPEARVMLVGEGPGFMEDRAGEPFVGPAGQLLDRILAAIGLSRQRLEPAFRWVYIANIVKCHPLADPAQPDKRGNDRPPSPEEIATCLPFLLKQVRIIRPRFLVALGATAARVLLNTARGITGLRGRWFDYAPPDAEPLRLLPTFHPSALLRNPELKRDVWTDMKSLRAEMEKAGFPLPRPERTK